jgi:preprotein translocase subunit YajC
MKNAFLLAQASQETSTSSVDSSQVSSQPAGQGQQSQTLQDSNAPAASAPARPQLLTQLIFIVPIILIIFFMFREPKRRQKQQQKLVQSLKKNDKVRTIGGIIGTIVDVKDDEIVLKIDEASNTKIRIIPSAVGRNLTNEA